jgi:hypothetical protein
VTFNDVSGLPTAFLTSFIDAVKMAASQYTDASGNTNIASGLCSARKQFQVTIPGDPAPTAPKEIALLSDGMSNTLLSNPPDDCVGFISGLDFPGARDQARDQANILARQGIIVHTIRYGKNRTFPGAIDGIQLMQDIAATTGGKFFFAETGDELFKIFSDLFLQPGLALVE